MARRRSLVSDLPAGGDDEGRLRKAYVVREHEPALAWNLDRAGMRVTDRRDRSSIGAVTWRLWQ
jgi:hypothetical protein